MQPSNDQHSRFHALATAAAAVVFLLMCAWAWRYTMDDTYISLRYAKHIGDGIGPVWNLVDVNDPVEGFTSFLHVWLLGALRFLTGMELEIPAKLLGVASMLGLLFLVVGASTRLGLGRLGTLVALSPFVLPYMAMNAVSGMETGIYVLLHTGCALTCVKLLDSPSRRGVRLFLLLGLLTTLTHPEFGATFVALFALAYWRLPGLRRQLLLAFLFCYVLPGVLLTGFRVLYYGDVVPNAFYRKQRLSFTPVGVDYVLKFLLMAASPFLLLAFSGWRRLRDEHGSLTLVTGLCLAIPCAYFSTTRPLMGWWFRFMLPQLPLLALLAAAAARGGLPSPRWATTARVGLLISTLGLGIAHLPAMEYYLLFHRETRARMRELGNRLGRFAEPDRWMAYYDVGLVAYTSEWNTRDVVGLNTRPSNLGNYCDMGTDLILLSRRPRATATRKEIDNPCADSFTPIADLPFYDEPPDSSRYLRIFARNGLDYTEELAAHVSRDWPTSFRHAADWKSRYTRRLSRWIFHPYNRNTRLWN